MIIAAELMSDILYLAVTIVTGGNDIGCPGRHDLIEFNFAVGPPLIREPGLEGTAPAAAAKIIHAVGNRINEVFFTHNGLDHKTEIINNLVGPALPTDIAGILNRELGTDVFIPVGIDLQLAFTNPLRIQLDNSNKFKFMRYLEFTQSFQDCKVRVPSLGVDHHGTFEIIVYMKSKLLNNVLPAFIVSHEHAVVLTCPHH